MERDEIQQKIADLIRSAEDAAYRRGYQQGMEDKAKEVMSVLQVRSLIASGGMEHRPTLITDSSELPTEQRNQMRPVSERQRAPKGIVPKFIARVLAEEPGLEPKEIAFRASDEYEKMIKLPSIRSELSAGKSKGKYEMRDGKWFLSGGAGGHSLPGLSPATDPNQGESEDAAPLGRSFLD